MYKDPIVDPFRYGFVYGVVINILLLIAVSAFTCPGDGDVGTCFAGDALLLLFLSLGIGYLIAIFRK